MASIISQIKAVIFDMDGVLVDSEEFICEAAVQMFHERGWEVQKEDFLPFVGTGENRYLGGVAEKYGLHLDLEKDKARTYQIYMEIVKGKLEPLPGVTEFIQDCRKNGFKLAVATSADEIKMLTNLRESGIQAENFDILVHGNAVKNKKPSPDIYLKAAERLGVEPKHCLVVEDAVSGIEAAKAAGAFCLALTTSFPQDKLTGADWIIGNLSEITIGDLIIRK